jgi:hypothetical protein
MATVKARSLILGQDTRTGALDRIPLFFSVPEPRATRNRRSVDDCKQPAPKPRRVNFKTIADLKKRTRLVIVRSKPQLSEVSKPRAGGQRAFIRVGQVDNGQLQDSQPQTPRVDHGGDYSTLSPIDPPDLIAAVQRLLPSFH